MMRWTKEKPTTLGWYWWRHRSYPNAGRWVAQVWQYDDGTVQTDSGFGSDVLLSTLDREWAGPIPEPEDL